MSVIKSVTIFISALFLSKMAFAQSVIKIDGSSTVFPITEAVSEEFQAAQKGKVHVTVGVSGTGGGFKKFCRGETDISDASRPIQASELEDCKKAGIKFFELPVAFDAIVIMVNPQNTWFNEANLADLKKMWEPDAQGKITKWNQVNPKWPDLPLKLYGPGSDSGTFDYFTEAVVGKSKASRGDYTASQDHNALIQGIANDKAGIGYTAYSYYAENKSKLKAVPVKVKNAVLPSEKTVEDGTYIPFSRPIFIYVNEAAYKRVEVADFVKFYMTSASKLVPEVKYIALPSKVYDTNLEHIKKSRVGTVFGGHSEMNMKIDELMKKEAKM